MGWDVAIVGGGPAGAAAAIGLALAGRRVLLQDAPRTAGRSVGESLPGGARPLLRALRLEEVVEAGPHRPSQGAWSVWGDPRPTPSDDPVSNPHGAGWHLDRRSFDRDLRGSAEGAGATVQKVRVLRVEAVAGEAVGGDGTPAVTSGRSQEPRWRLHRSDGSAVTARWLVDASGRAASVARGLGATRRRDGDLVALAAWIRSSDTDDRTLVEAVPEGWWYTARLPGQERVAVLHVGAAEAAEILHDRQSWCRRLAETRWVRRVTREVGPAEGDLLEGPRGTDAAGARLDRFAGDGWMAVGDAALSFDPLSSQGLLDAIYTGHLAAGAVDAALDGDAGAVTAYASRLESVRAAYLRHLRQAYRAEDRWPDSDFWRRRHGTPVPG